MSVESNLYEQIVVKGKTPNVYYNSTSRTYRGISTVNKSRKNKVLFDLELIKQDILNHFHIRQGEKLSDPTFGTILWDVLFEPFTPSLKDLIVDNVKNIVAYEPRVTTNRVIVDTYESGIQVEMELTYLPYNISENMRLKFDKEVGFIS